ncbi:MAG TPA: hypothetical protein VIV27_07265 [Halioglobus sp.]
MKKATKAALLSGLVFPGVGHLYLKRWIPGLLLIGVAGYFVYSISSDVMGITMDIVQQIESGAVSSDIDTINQLVSQQLSGREQAMNMATMAFAACWVVGVVGAWWQGRAQDII